MKIRNNTYTMMNEIGEVLYATSIKDCLKKTILYDACDFSIYFNGELIGESILDVSYYGYDFTSIYAAEFIPCNAAFKNYYLFETYPGQYSKSADKYYISHGYFKKKEIKKRSRKPKGAVYTKPYGTNDEWEKLCDLKEEFIELNEED